MQVLHRSRQLSIPSRAQLPASFPFRQIANSFGAQNATPTDYPGIGFQLELLLSGLSFHLGSSWFPGKVNSDFTITRDTTATNQDVRIVMPKILARYTQAEDFSQSPTFKLASWGNPGFDAPNDLSEGELATMDPPLAVHSSGRVAFGVDTLILDLSEDSTPAEILEHFGTDEGFEGVYVKALQVYYADANKDFALNFAVRDALISFKGEVSLEAELDLLFINVFTVAITMYDGKKSITVNKGTASGNTWTGGSATVPPNVAMYLRIAGGVPPYTTTVTFDGSSDLVLTDTLIESGRSTAIRDFRRALLATRLGIPADATQPSFVALSDARTAYRVVKDALAAGGLGDIEPVWDGSAPGTTLATTLPIGQSNPEGREFDVATAILISTLATAAGV